MRGREDDRSVVMLRMRNSDLAVRRSGKRAGRDDGMSARRARLRSGRSEKRTAKGGGGATDALQEVDVTLVPSMMVPSMMVPSTTTDWSGARCTEVMRVCMCLCVCVCMCVCMCVYILNYQEYSLVNVLGH